MQLSVFTCLLVLLGVHCHAQEPPTDTELNAISEALWSMDENRLPAGDYTINPEGPKLFTNVNEAAFQRPNYARFIALLDNYTPETGTPEPPCQQCRDEEDTFLDTVLETPVMRRAWEWLADRDLASTTLSGFKEELKQYWFQVYSRSGGRALDSSGFEHVFVGELKNGQVSGFHNWVRYYQEEKADNLQMVEFMQTCDPEILKLSFDWLGYTKPITSVIAASSPELELALYTVCFQARQSSSCYVSLDGNSQEIKVYSMNGVFPRTVGTVYPQC